MEDTLTNIIGYIAACCTTYAFLPQAVKIIRTRDTRALSLSMYMIFTTGVGLWTIYSLIIMSWPMIAGNVVTLALAATILVLKLRYG